MSEENKKASDSLIEKIKCNKKLQYLIIIFLAVIAILIFASTYYSDADTVSSNDTVEYYVNNLENRLEQALSKVEGAGKVTVVITVESGMETVLATETTVKDTGNGKETIESPIVVNGKTVVLKELYPQISGVLIVAEGANSISVLTKIQQAAKSLLDIDVNKIEILTMK